MKAKLARVLGEEAAGGAPTMAQEAQMNEPKPFEPATAESVETTDDEDTMSYFARLANED